MFERFTDRARRVVVLAQEEAHHFGHHEIRVEHLVLGLIAEKDGIAGLTFATLQIDLEAARGQVAHLLAANGFAGEPSGHLPFTAAGKRLMELALREALQLGHNYIGTEHLLLAWIRPGENCYDSQLLSSLHVDVAEIRAEVMRQLAPPVQPVLDEPQHVVQYAVRLPDGHVVELGSLASPPTVVTRTVTTIVGNWEPLVSTETENEHQNPYNDQVTDHAE